MGAAETPLLVSEDAIAKYGPVALAQWAFLLHNTRRSGSVIYQGFTDQRAGKFGWGRSKFFGVMRNLVSVGLASKDRWGNWKLATTGKVRGDIKHKCTLLLPRKADERFIRDLLFMKLVEMGHRQRMRYSMTPEQMFESGRINVKTCGRMLRQAVRPAQNPKKGLLGSTPEELLKCAQNGFAAMNTERLMDLTSMGRAQLFSWKRRARGRGWFTQEDRRWAVPDELLPGLPVMQEVWERECRGRFSFGSIPKFHQASMYRMNMKY